MRLIRAFGHYIAAIFLVLFVVVLPLTIWAYNLQEAVFNRSLQQQIVQSDNLYTSALPTLFTEVVFDVNEDELSQEGQYIKAAVEDFTQDEWQQTFLLLTPIDWLKEQITTNLDATIAWLDSSDIRPPVALDLTLVKDRLTSDEGQQFVQLVIESQPECDASQQEALAQALGDPSAELPQCSPQGDTRTTLTEDLNEAVVVTANDLPDNVPTQEELEQPISERQRTEFLNTKLSVRVVRRVPFLIFLLPLWIMLLIHLITVRTFKGFFGWTGWALLIGGILTVLTSFDVTPILLVSRGGSDPQTVESFIFLTTIISQITRPILIQGGIVLGVGLLCALLSSTLKPAVDK